MKEMIYYDSPKSELLYSGKYKGLEFYIKNLGTHPSAYVKIPETSNLYLKDYLDIDIYVHGGLSYSDGVLYVENKKLTGWFIGWDYCHCDDYSGYYSKMGFIRTGKKWTTKEIYEDVKQVINQVIKMGGNYANR